MRFEEKWTSIVEAIRAVLSPSVLKPERIDCGKYGELPTNPPFVYVYMEPKGGSKLENNIEKENKCVITVVCGIPAALGKTEAKSKAVELAHIAQSALKNYKCTSKIETDGVYNNVAVSFFELESSYDSPTIENFKL